MKDIGKVENVKVFVRIRPLRGNETQNCTKRYMEIDRENNLILLNNIEYREFEKKFAFHRIFTEETSQFQIYETVAAPIVETVLNGFNGTIFAYGQTGSGKTYTMVGDHFSVDFQGIIPNAFTQIFNQISRSAIFKSFIVTVTFLEIYNEEIRDLLSTEPRKLKILENESHGQLVKGLTGFTVNSIEEIRKLFIRGNKNRCTKSNDINLTSSRSHAIFAITVESKNHNTKEITVGKLNFVDLAGSERLGRTGATGSMLKEATHINLSLSVLGNVISSLVDGRKSHIPYRNSKLTRLLQDSLGGNSKTAMIATLSLADLDYDESVCTLRFATRVRYIENCVCVNKKEDGFIASFEKQIEELRDKLRIIDEEQQKKQKKQQDHLMKSMEKKKIQEELCSIENEKQQLVAKIDAIQEKIIVGRANLLGKVEEQYQLLEKTSGKITELDENNSALKELLDKKSMEKIELKQNYSSLQEESEDLDKQILEIQEKLRHFREEQQRKHSEQRFEIERKLEDSRALICDSNLNDLLLEKFIPKVYLRQIESNLEYSQRDGEFRLKHIIHTGNNIVRKTNFHLEKDIRQRIKPQFIKSNKKRARYNESI